MKVQDQIKALSSYIPEMDKSDEDVSKVQVGWHIYHALLVIVKVIRMLEQSESSTGPLKTTMFQRIFFFLKLIPRGKAKAPRAVRPPDDFSQQELIGLEQKALSMLSSVSEISPLAQFDHPRVGILNKDKAMKFLAIHTTHHLKIIKDILK